MLGLFALIDGVTNIVAVTVLLLLVVATALYWCGRLVVALIE